ncbi:hypothetical protein [Pseudoduganella lutea]|uniref:Uncharacterized protein n=1 Tax=Pseudoduganella lutea TaxID=321985 RepID=A0A4P6L5E5_9BURK|nr:hypothetical protein [Pseudoduganella lutea]QBE66727.1 hypothetical protein EWM63_30275 [Pseudoduganella lutea]
MKILLVLALSLFVHRAVLADVISFGAASRCQGSGFELSAVTQHNKQFSLVVNNMEGVRVLPKGAHKLQCRVGKDTVKIDVRISEGTNGMCMGAGYVEVKNFTVGSIRLPDSGPFNWKCEDTAKMLVKLRIYPTSDGLRLERCSADEWSWERGYVNLDCEYSRIRETTDERPGIPRHANRHMHPRALWAEAAVYWTSAIGPEAAVFNVRMHAHSSSDFL